jgi:Protein of unknown function (DUF3179)
MRARSGFSSAIVAAAVYLVAAAPGGDPPAGFKRYFPKERFPSLDAPVYVKAAEADTPPDAWVLGVVVEGQARAYELNLLTRYEVVNDRIGERPVAIVWCPLANSGVAYDRRVGDRELRFEPSGVLMHGSIVIQDKETESFWPLLHEKSLYGPLEGRSLTRIPGVVKARFADWVREHPDTLVWSLYGQEQLSPNPMMSYLASSSGYRGTLAEDARLATKEPVFGFLRQGTPFAVAASDLAGGRSFAVKGGSVFLYRSSGAALNETTRAFASTRGFALKGGAWLESGTGARFDPAAGRFRGTDVPSALEGFDTFWYVWSLNYPGTALLGR